MFIGLNILGAQKIVYINLDTIDSFREATVTETAANKSIKTVVNILGKSIPTSNTLKELKEKLNAC